MTSHRIERLADAIRATLSELLLTETRDPRLRLATISSVRVTGDLQLAHVAVSIADPEIDRDEFMKALEGAAGFLRSQLARRLSLRHTPQLRFRIDRGAEHSERIEEILDRLRAQGDQGVQDEADAEQESAPADGGDGDVTEEQA